LTDTKLFDFLALGKRGDTALPDAHAWLAGDTGERDSGLENGAA
jgi:tRNA 2-thiocytidine biosynthesis protein TtcA